MIKKCSGCGLEKEETLDNFKWRNDRNKFVNPCKICMNEYGKQYYQENKEEIQEQQEQYRQEHKQEISERDKQYYQENKEEILEYQKQYREENKNEILEYKKQYNKEHKEEKREYDEQYYQKNKKEIKTYKREHQRNRRKNDPEYRLHKNISRQIHHVLKGKKGGKSVLKYLPYTMKELRKHIEDQFKKLGNEWMNWDNYGRYNKDTHNKNPTWQLDHKTPHSSFHYKTMDCQEIRDCWALSNLQPLDSLENIKKC